MTQNIDASTLIWMRYTFADSQLYELTKKWGRQMVFEHNTLEEEEAMLIQKKLWRTMPFSISKSYLKFTFETWIRQRTDESRWGKKILQEGLGGICVTHEIAKYEKKRFPKYPTFVLPNCINIDSNKNHDLSKDSSKQNTDHQRWVMLIGSMAEWHGMDRLINSLRNSPLASNKSIHVDIIGVNNDINVQTKLPSNTTIQFLGKIQPTEIEATLKTYHLAIGSLAFYKIKISEACPLKVRDYWRAGLPVLMAYQDTSCMENPTLAQFQFYASNNPQDLPIEKIHDFVTQLYHQPNINEEIRNIAFTSIDYQKKILSLLIFFQSILQKSI
jgi:glycosyltransferase involved in cell wall biosynthesis